jgi:HK97 family phage major capsid protein
MSYKEKKDMLSKLKKELDRFKRLSHLTDEQREVKAELEEAINEIRLQLPQQSLTAQGGSYTSSGPFDTPGEFFQSVMRAGIPGQPTDPRLYQTRDATGLSETVPSDGGFLVQNDFARELLQDVIATGLLIGQCRRVEIGGNSNSIKIPGVDETSRVSGYRYGGILAYWEDEAAAKTATKPKFRLIDLILKKLIGLCYATDELIDDAPLLAETIRKGFASEFGFMIDDAIINGTGGGLPLGIMNSGSLVTVAKESGQAANTIVYENLCNMWSRLIPGSHQNSVWLVNANCLPQLFQMSLSVGTGGLPVYLPANAAAGEPNQTLFGRPLIPIEQAQSVGTTGDILLCDFKDGYIIGEKGGIRGDMSIHVRFIYDESVFRFVWRIDGQPVRASALTPYKGSQTLSHFVALATRS